MRDQILALKDLPTIGVAIPEWDGTVVQVRALTAGEAEQYGREALQAQSGGGSLLNMMARLVVKVVVDELGDRIFGDDDVDAVSGKNAKAVQRIFEAAQVVSGMAEEPEETGNV